MRYLIILLAVFAIGLVACDDDDNGDDPAEAVTPAGSNELDSESGDESERDGGDDVPAAVACTGGSALASGEGPPPVEGEPMTTNSGLQIQDITEGEGAEAGAGGTVCVHYTGWLEDGTVFDSSVERGEPVSFPLAQVITGWQEGIPGMKIGGTRRLVIPPELAYGEAGREGIPPNATLTFDVELIAVE